MTESTNVFSKAIQKLKDGVAENIQMFKDRNEDEWAHWSSIPKDWVQKQKMILIKLRKDLEKVRVFEKLNRDEEFKKDKESLMMVSVCEIMKKQIEAIKVFIEELPVHSENLDKFDIKVFGFMIKCVIDGAKQTLIFGKNFDKFMDKALLKDEFSKNKIWGFDERRDRKYAQIDAKRARRDR
ncbi:MAG: hypothetical protein LBB23_02715 [Rickettsiales bacterium]|nr:hypothetical protein [Rickettsiales bacterium]